MNWLNRILNKEMKTESRDDEKTLAEIKFSMFDQKAGENNFRFMLNENLIDKKQRTEYNYCWLISLQVFEKNQDGMPTEIENEYLMTVFQKLISRILEENNIKIVGTITADVFEIFFYALEKDSSKIGDCIVESKNDLEDRHERFIQWSGKKDTEWNTVSDLYELFFK